MHGRAAAKVACAASDHSLWPNGVNSGLRRCAGTTVEVSPPSRSTRWVLAAADLADPSRDHNRKAAAFSDCVIARRS